MTLARFVTKNAFRNKRRTILTALSIAFSLFLMTFMMTLWRAFGIDEGSSESTRRLVVRHRGSLMFTLPSYYAEKMRDSGGSCGGAALVVSRGLQRPEARKLLCAIRNRPE